MWMDRFDANYLSKMALWFNMKKWMIWLKGKGSIYKPRGRGMDGQDARMSESLWSARMS